jgi:hypothetical protein
MTPPRRPKRPRIDWGAAMAAFVAMDPPRTFAAVARQFGVSDVAVRKHAKDEGWEQAAADADSRAAAKALERAGKTREERTAQLLRIYDQAADRVELAIKVDDKGHAVLDDDVVFAKFPELHRLYRLETEQATDHVALAEVQAGLRTSMQVAIETCAMVAAELLGERKAAELARAFRARFLPAVNEALAIGGGDQ